jgi:hypothetical protein
MIFLALTKYSHTSMISGWMVRNVRYYASIIGKPRHCRHYSVGHQTPMSTTATEVMALLKAIEDASAKVLFTDSCQLSVSHAAIAWKLAGSRADGPQPIRGWMSCEGRRTSGSRHDKQDAEIGRYASWASPEQHCVTEGRSI